MKNQWKTILCVLSLFFYRELAAGENDPPKTIGRDHYEKIKVDLKNGVIETTQPLPFDVPFIFYGAVDSEITSITVYMKQASSINFTNKNDSIYTCNCDFDFKDSYRICSWKKIYYSPTSSPDSFYITMPALKANAGYQFYFKLTRKYNPSELASINQEQKSYLLTTIRDKFNDLYDSNPTTAKTKLFELYEKHTNTWIETMFVTPSTDTTKQVAPKPNYTKDKKDKFWSKSKEEASNLEWSKLANQIAVIKGEFNATDQLETNAKKSWVIFKKDLANFIDPKNKNEFVLPDSLWIMKVLNGIVGDGDILKAVSGKYNLNTNTPSSFKDLQARLDSASVEEKLTNQQILLDKLNAEYDNLQTLNKDKKGWLTFSNILKQFHAEVNAYSNSTRIIKKAYYDLCAQINKLNAKDILDEIEIDMPNSGSTIANFMTRAEYYITADIGFAYAWFNRGYSNSFDKDWNEILPYTGVNFNLASINRQARYRYRKYKNIAETPFKSWAYVQSKKISIVMGISLVSVGKEVDSITYRKGIVGTSKDLALLSGVAYRLGDYARISAGFVFSKYRDQNLLVEDYHLKATPYISLSLDLDVKKFAENIVSVIKPGSNE